MNFLVLILTLGIVIIRSFWVYFEVRSFKFRLNRGLIITNFIEVIILSLQILVVYFFPLPKTTFDPLIIAIGVVLYSLGMILAIWARLTMKYQWGIPGKHYINKQKKLVTTGPFHFSRNPIYVAFILVYLGFCIAIKSWLVILRIPLFIYFYKSVLKEEENLTKLFGKEYLDYKKKTPRYLLI